MRVLVTGGFGCIGVWIIRNLVESGDDVWVFDLKFDPRRAGLLLTPAQMKQIKFLAGDVAEVAALKAALDENRITHVIHLAGLQVPTCRADPLLGARVNVLGTIAVFEAVKAAKSPVDGLVYASSAAVFSPPDTYAGMKHPLPDDAPLNPATHYGFYKLCNEGNARIYFQDHGLSSIGLRPGSVYGVGRDFGLTSEPTKAIKAVALGRKYHISYGGRQDLQFADDVAKSFVQCLQRPYHGAKAYNIRGSVVDQATFHRSLCAAAPEAERLVTFGDRQLPVTFDLDDSALQADLGPMPRTSLDDGIRQTYEQFRRLHSEGRLDDADLG